MRLSFQSKLALFLAGVLLVVQAVNALALRELARELLIDDGAADLVQARLVTEARLRQTNERLEDGVRLLAADSSFRNALLNADRAPLREALDVLGGRLRADRTMLIDGTNSVLIDLGAGSQPLTDFPLPALRERAIQTGAASVVTSLDGVLHRLAVVPVAGQAGHALAVAVRMDDAFVSGIRQLAPRGVEVTFAVRQDNSWRIAASTLARAAQDEVTRLLGEAEAINGDERHLRVAGHNYLSQVSRLPVAATEGAAVALLLQVDTAIVLARLHDVLTPLAMVLALALAAALALGIWLVQQAMRPLNRLAVAAERVAAGDYAVPLPVAGSDALARLGQSFQHMIAAIADREAKLNHAAGHDALTGLPNRASLEAHLSERIPQAVAEGTALDVLLVGIDRLPEVSATLGHGTADRLLRRVARRLVGVMGAEAWVARLNDSSFAVVIGGLGLVQVLERTEDLLQAFEAPFQVNELTIDAAIHIGIAMCPDHGDSARLLLRRADVALAAARRMTERRAVYDLARDGNSVQRVSLMGELREGLARNEFQLVYQPKLNLRTGRVLECEALVRWQHPRRGPIPPDQFVPLAEQTGEIVRLTAWAIEQATAQIAAWSALGCDVRVAINLSARDLGHHQLPRRLRDALQRHAVPADRLALEITESFLIEDTHGAIGTLAELRALGLKIVIDDFGAGYAAMGYLKMLPIDELKIDQLLVRDVLNDPKGRSIVRACVELGHGLGLTVTAEGAEDDQTIAFLRDAGCDHVQGYGIARPLNPDEFLAFVQR